MSAPASHERAERRGLLSGGVNDALDWWILLAFFALFDVALTALALQDVTGARELNPLPAAAFAHGAPVALALKVATLLLVLVLVLQLEKRHPRWARGLLAVWTTIYVVVDAYSLIALAAAGVFA